MRNGRSVLRFNVFNTNLKQAAMLTFVFDYWRNQGFRLHWEMVACDRRLLSVGMGMIASFCNAYSTVILDKPHCNNSEPTSTVIRTILTELVVANLAGWQFTRYLGSHFTDNLWWSNRRRPLVSWYTHCRCEHNPKFAPCTTMRIDSNAAPIFTPHRNDRDKKIVRDKYVRTFPVVTFLRELL